MAKDYLLTLDNKEDYDFIHDGIMNGTDVYEKIANLTGIANNALLLVFDGDPEKQTFILKIDEESDLTKASHIKLSEGDHRYSKVDYDQKEFRL
jgi:hypothetical protein